MYPTPHIIEYVTIATCKEEVSFSTSRWHFRIVKANGEISRNRAQRMVQSRKGLNKQYAYKKRVDHIILFLWELSFALQDV